MLTERQLQVTRLICEGKSNPEIAKALGISINTVKDSIRLIFRKLGVSSREEVAHKAVLKRIVRIEKKSLKNLCPYKHAPLLPYVSKGLSNPQIARAMKHAEPTINEERVKARLEVACRLLGIEDRAHLAALYAASRL